MKRIRNDIILLIIILVISGVIWFIFKTANHDGTVAKLTYNGNQETEIQLSRDGNYDFESNGMTIHLKVTGGAIAFVDSPCPDHICESYGWLSKDGEVAVCLPAKASIVIIEK